MKQIYLIIVIVVGLGWLWFFPVKEEIILVHQGPINIDPIIIEFEGEVVFPGIYHFFEPITINDALKYAGGATKDADLAKIQTSEIIVQSRFFHIPSKIETPDQPMVKLNINEASFKQLIAIPGITEIRAASIIIYRENNGDFHSLDELIHVKNIGVVTLEKIKPYLTVG